MASEGEKGINLPVYHNPNFLDDEETAHSVKPNSESGKKSSTETGKGEGFVTTSADRTEAGETRVEVRAEHRDKQTGKTTAFCRFIVHRYKLAFVLTLGSHLLFIIVSVILIGSGYNLLPLNFKQVPLDLSEDVTFLRTLAWESTDLHDKVSESTYEYQPPQQPGVELVLIYEGGNVFTKERLKAISDFESELMAERDTQKSIKPYSIIRFFDGTYGPNFNDSTFEDIPKTLEAANADKRLRDVLQYFLGNGAVISSTEATSYITRTKMIISDDTFLPKLKEAVESGVGGMSFLFYSKMLLMSEVFDQVTKDLLLAAGSFMFIVIFMLFQTQSFFLTSFAIFSIISSFVGSNLIYRIVFDYRYFGIFHVLSVFIILGIGADDIFVYLDTWRGTAGGHYSSLEERVTACYVSSRKTMFMTTLTTMVAFLINAFSPILAIRSFGLFSGILVFVNYLSVITFLPVVVVVYHKHWESKTLPCTKRCCKKVQVATQGKSSDQKNVVVRFFRDPFFRFVTHRIARWIICVVGFILIAVFIYFASLLEPDTGQLQIYKDTHYYGKAIRRIKYSFKPTTEDKTIQVYMVWGLKPQDRHTCHKTDFECTGTTVWDDTFDLNPKHAQTELLNLCHNIRDMPDWENTELHIRRNQNTNKMEVLCFTDELNKYMTDLGNTSKYNYSDLSLPLSESKVTFFMEANPDIYNLTADYSNFYRYFETAVMYWISNGYNESDQSTERFALLLGQAEDKYDTMHIKDDTKHFYGSRLRYAAIVINTTLTETKMNYVTGIPAFDAWENFTQTLMKQLPGSLTGGFQCTPHGEWQWFKFQKILSDSAIKGIIIGICTAFPILTLATMNIILGFLATATIGCVTACVVGVIPLAGWKLGVLESINLSLIVGLSVDYVVHLAEGYHRSAQQRRVDRVQDMLEHVGISVLSGASTTIGASFFMLFAQIMFFMQFGIFMFCTIAFSILFSLVLFSTLLGFVGPENKTGSLVAFYDWLKCKIKPKTN